MVHVIDILESAGVVLTISGDTEGGALLGYVLITTLGSETTNCITPDHVSSNTTRN